MIESLAKSTVQVFNENNEPVTDKIKAVVVKDAIRIFRPTVKVEPGYLVRHYIDIGDDLYTVLEANYSEGLHSIPPSYELIVRNVKSIKTAEKTTLARSIVHNTINLGANGRVYQDSNDYSVNSISQTTSNYSQVINKLREDIKALNLDAAETLLSDKIIDNIQVETSQTAPNSSKIQTLISLLPVGVQALDAAVELGKIFTA